MRMEHQSPKPNIFTSFFSTFIGKESVSNNPVPKIAIGLFIIITIVLMFPHGVTKEYHYTLGSVWVDEDLIAPFSFSVDKDPKVYEAEKAQAARAAYPVFVRDEKAAIRVRDSLRSLFAKLSSALEIHARILKAHSPEDSLAFDSMLDRIPFDIKENDWRALSKIVNDPSSMEHIWTHLSEILDHGILNSDQMKQSTTAFALRKGLVEEIIPSSRVYDQNEALSAVESKMAMFFEDEQQSAMAFQIAQHTLRPNLLYNETETKRAIQMAEESVPRTLGFVKENERIVSKHERISDEVKLRLDSFQQAKIDREVDSDEWKHWVGTTLHVGLIVSLYAIYIFLFRKRIYGDNSRLVILAILLLFESLLAYVSVQVDIPQPVRYLVIIPTASMLMVILFDSRVAFYGTVIMAFLIAGILGNDYAFALTSLVAGAFGAYTVRDIKSRTQIFRSMIFIFIGYAVSILALSFEQFDNASMMVTQLTFALVNAVISPLITYGLLLFFERAFNVTTDLRLIELADFNQPLLKELSEKAPGTFHHSVLLGNLAEAAAEAVGANAILAKVGAYYHDIGKMDKPEYFVENQIGVHSKHSRLRPRMSALIIAAHVKEGVEFARKAALPERIIDFIPQHHGTTRIAFFYDKAVKQAERKGTGEVIQEDDFRYPGPKPQSKETAIVMLADSVEASTRALSNLSPQELEDAIDAMIKQRFSEGQLDDCNLMLKDLSQIKEAFLKILVGIHHQRVPYPAQQQSVPENGNEPASSDKNSHRESNPSAQSTTVPEETNE